jgi:hypothetical protein
LFERDHIVRQIQQATAALARVLLRKRNGEYDEALAEIRESGQVFTGLDLHDPQHLTFDELMAPLQAGGEPDAERAGIVAELLRQQGELYALKGLPERAARSNHLALALFLDVYQRGSRHRSPDTLGRIDALLGEIDWRDATPGAQRRLFRYLADTGRFGQAEDVLFVLADEEPNQALYEEGVAFFRRLWEKPRPALEAGGLPFHEVGEGLRAFNRKLGGYHDSDHHQPSQE